MLIGSVICNYWRKLWGYKKALAVAGILLAAFLITAHWALLSSPAEKPTISTYLFALVIFVCSYFGRSRFPRWKQLAFLSNISYPLYLIHGVNGYILLTVFYPYLPVPWLDNVVVFSILIGAAWLIHRFIEIPSHKFGQRLGTKLSQ
jgi:peptidoglycan/LPS O-acetylase OafA/YrhL